MSVTLERTREYPVPVDDAWALLADTDRLNEAVGLPQVAFSPPDPGAAMARAARASKLGLELRWRELPFEWVRERGYTVRREFERGPLAAVEGGVGLTPFDGGTRVRVFADVAPAGALGRVAARRLAARTVDRVVAVCDEVQGGDRAGGRPRPVAPLRSRARVDARRLAEALGRLARAPVPPRLVDRLAALLRDGDDRDVVRVQPLRLAGEWGERPRDVLALFLHATRAGIFDLRWELMCPTCRVPGDEVDTLAELPGRFHCDTCGIDYETELARRVELRFTVHPAIRTAPEDAIYCVAGPMRTPHILAQQRLAPGERRSVALAAAEPLRVRAFGRPERARLVPAAGAGARTSVALAGDDGREAAFAPGAVDIELVNDSGGDAVAVIERERWDELACTAAEVTTLQEFHDLFGSEVLAPGQEVAVRTIALLFTDLVGSTALYEDVGDAPAYGRVHRHFDLLGERIAAHDGAIVKTLGDAVMAAFVDAERALAAALAVQRALPAWCAREGVDPPLRLRIGVHAGPAIAVTANGRLDYFGRTVNMAARVAATGEAGAVVMLADLAEQPAVRERLEREAEPAGTLTATLRGVSRPCALVRVRPRGRGAEAAPASGPDVSAARTGGAA
jgi:adenylate cyclase